MPKKNNQKSERPSKKEPKTKGEEKLPSPLARMGVTPEMLQTANSFGLGQVINYLSTWMQTTEKMLTDQIKRNQAYEKAFGELGLAMKELEPLANYAKKLEAQQNQQVQQPQYPQQVPQVPQGANPILSILGQAFKGDDSDSFQAQFGALMLESFRDSIQFSKDIKDAVVQSIIRKKLPVE